MTWRVKFDGPCAKCGRRLGAGTVANWDRQARRMTCVECLKAAVAPAEPSIELAAEPAPYAPATEVDPGVAGRSARERHDRLMEKRHDELQSRWGTRVGGWIERLTVEPQSIAAWGIGAAGEEAFAAAIDTVPGVRVLHDRSVPRGRRNIDHLVIAPAGVFVVDAKHYDGLIEIRDVGGWFRTDLRLYVGGRDRSTLAAGLGWQVNVATEALTASGIDPLPPMTPVLCFIDGEWPWFRPPNEFEGVRLESERSIAKILVEPAILDGAAIDRVWAALAARLPIR